MDWHHFISSVIAHTKNPRNKDDSLLKQTGGERVKVACHQNDFLTMKETQLHILVNGYHIKSFQLGNVSRWYSEGESKICNYRNVSEFQLDLLSQTYWTQSGWNRV